MTLAFLVGSKFFFFCIESFERYTKISDLGVMRKCFFGQSVCSYGFAFTGPLIPS